MPGFIVTKTILKRGQKVERIWDDGKREHDEPLDCDQCGGDIILC